MTAQESIAGPMPSYAHTKPPRRPWPDRRSGPNKGVGDMRKHLLPALVGATALVLAGCSGMNHTEQRVLTGSLIGAGVGTATTVITGGCIWCGALIGGAAGAGAGYVYDQIQ